jgi:predicted metal-binding membrane protein
VAHAPTLESFLRRDRTVVAAALFAVTAIAWVYLVYMARDMNVEGGLMEWGIDCFTAMFVMWMVAAEQRRRWEKSSSISRIRTANSRIFT